MKSIARFLGFSAFVIGIVCMVLIMGVLHLIKIALRWVVNCLETIC